MEKKRLAILLDLDSTLFPVEFINELAKEVGKEEEVGEITRKAMQGKMPIEEALRKRLSLITPIKRELIKKVIERAKRAFLSSNGKEFLGCLEKLGFEVFVLTHSFDFITNELEEWLSSLSFKVTFFSNKTELVEKDGEIVEIKLKEILDKGRLASSLSSSFYTVAVGDGFNDIPMLKNSDVSISLNKRLSPYVDIVANSLEEVCRVLKRIVERNAKG